jgi:hypothetical protein
MGGVYIWHGGCEGMLYLGSLQDYGFSTEAFYCGYWGVLRYCSIGLN